MRQRSALKRHGNQMLLSVIDALANSLRDFSGLADAGADAARATAGLGLAVVASLAAAMGMGVSAALEGSVLSIALTLPDAG